MKTNKIKIRLTSIKRKFDSLSHLRYNNTHTHIAKGNILSFNHTSSDTATNDGVLTATGGTDHTTNGSITPSDADDHEGGTVDLKAVFEEETEVG